LSWYQWANPYKADATSENALDRMMAEPDVNKFCQDLTDKLGRLPASLIPDSAPQDMIDAVSVVGPQLVDGILRKQGCFFVESFEITADQEPKAMKAGLVLEIGDNVDEAFKSINTLLKTLGAPAETISLGDQNAIKVAVPPNGPFTEVVVLQQDAYVVAATSVEMAKEIAGRMKAGQVPGWLGELQAKQKYSRTAAVGRIDLAALKNQLMPLADEQAAKTIKALGLDNLAWLEFSGGYGRTDFAQRMELKFDGAPTGIFAAFGDQGLAVEDIKHFPADSFLAFAASIDGRTLLSEFSNILIQLDPQSAQQMAGGLIKFQSETGIDLRKLIENLGPTFTLHNGYGDGVLSGVMLRATTQDPEYFEKSIDQAMVLLMSKLRMSLAIDSTEQNGQTVNILRFGGAPVPVEPSWFVKDDQMTLALFPSVLASATNPKLAPSLVDSDSFKPYLNLVDSSDGKVIGFSYSETKRSYELLYGYACLMSAMGKNMVAGPLSRSMGLPFNDQQFAKVRAEWSDLQLPSCRSVVKHLTPQVAVVRKESDAIVFEGHSSLANTNLTMVAPGIAVGMLLPAVQGVRAAARRTQSLNNLRQLALAALNYESARQRFPSGDGPVVKDGPEVSWRVKILPYIEQEKLYDQYNFNEPWDSENNLQVAKRMPELFKNPASATPEGFTVYRGIGGTSGVMGVNAEGNSIGKTFGNLTDGSSNTILFLEVPDESAVPWTKPDGGIDPGNVKPSQMVGKYSGGFNAAFCDGSTHFLSESLDAETFKRLLDFKDGQVVGEY
jgi:hypothetical protein